MRSCTFSILFLYSVKFVAELKTLLYDKGFKLQKQALEAKISNNYNETASPASSRLVTSCCSLILKLFKWSDSLICSQDFCCQDYVTTNGLLACPLVACRAFDHSLVPSCTTQSYRFGKKVIQYRVAPKWHNTRFLFFLVYAASITFINSLFTLWIF